MNIYASMSEPASAVMEKAHAEYKLNEQEIYYISAYLSHIVHKEIKPFKIFPTRLLIFILFAVLLQNQAAASPIASFWLIRSFSSKSPIIFSTSP